GVDLVACLVSDIKEAINNEQIAAALLLDVLGAFDTVIHYTLVERLKSQGWPECVLRYVASLCSGRTIVVSHEGERTEPRAPWGGIPQGSPISLILFLLYIEPIAKLPGAQRR